jgi:prophage regulatory protein
VRKIIRKPAVRERTGYSGTQIWRLEQLDKFPARVQLGPNSVGWFEDEVDAWVLSRIRGGCRQPPLPRNRRAINSPEAEPAALSAASPEQPE